MAKVAATDEFVTGKRHRVLDRFKRTIPWVASFDDETKEAELFIQIGKHDNGKPIFLVSDGEVVKVKVTLPDATMIELE